MQLVSKRKYFSMAGLAVLFSVLATWALIEALSLTALYLNPQQIRIREQRYLGYLLRHPLLFPRHYARHSVFAIQDLSSPMTSIWHPYRSYANPPNVINRVEALSTDSYGFTHNGTKRTYRIPKPQGIKRVILLGGSAAEGHGASGNSDTIAAHLERKLGEYFQEPFQVINAGVGGYASIEELNYLTADLLKLQPDYVITFDGVNDVWLAHEIYDNAGFFLPNYSYYQINTIKRIIDTVRLDNNAWFHLSSGFRLLMKRIFPYTHAYLSGFIRKKGAPAQSALLNASETRQLFYWDEPFTGLTNDELNQLTADQYLSNLESIASICIRKGIPLILSVQPEQIDYYEVTDYFSTIQQGILAMGDPEHKVSAILFQPLFDQMPENFFVDEVHLNGKGQAIVADKFSEIIREFEAARR